MNQILPYALWIGHAGEGHDFRQVFGSGIRAVVDVALEEAPAPPPRELIFLRIPLLDSSGNRASMLFLAVHSLVSLLRMRVPTLVVCGSGMSRAPSVAAAALALVLQESPEECLKRIAEHHSHDVSPGFWKELIDLLDSDTDAGTLSLSPEPPV